MKSRTSDADVGKGPQCQAPRCNTSGWSGSSRNARISERSAKSSKARSAGATTITAGSSRTISVCVCVSWRYSVSQRRPRGVVGTSDWRCPIMFTWASAPRNSRRSSPSRGSVSATGIQPNGAQASGVNPTGTSPARRLRWSSLVSSPVGRSAGVLHFRFLTLRLCFDPCWLRCAGVRCPELVPHHHPRSLVLLIGRVLELARMPRGGLT